MLWPFLAKQNVISRSFSFQATYFLSLSLSVILPQSDQMTKQFAPYKWPSCAFGFENSFVGKNLMAHARVLGVIVYLRNSFNGMSLNLQVGSVTQS